MQEGNRARYRLLSGRRGHVKVVIEAGLQSVWFEPPGKNTLSEARYVDWLGVRPSVAGVWYEIPTGPFGSNAE